MAAFMEALANFDMAEINNINHDFIGGVGGIQEDLNMQFIDGRYYFSEQSINPSEFIDDIPYTAQNPDNFCSICLCEDTEPFVTLYCHHTHIFHKECIFEWLKQSLHCPTCKTKQSSTNYPKPPEPSTSKVIKVIDDIDGDADFLLDYHRQGLTNMTLVCPQITFFKVLYRRHSNFLGDELPEEGSCYEEYLTGEPHITFFRVYRKPTSSQKLYYNKNPNINSDRYYSHRQAVT